MKDKLSSNVVGNNSEVTHVNDSYHYKFPKIADNVRHDAMDRDYYKNLAILEKERQSLTYKYSPVKELESAWLLEDDIMKRFKNKVLRKPKLWDGALNVGNKINDLKNKGDKKFLEKNTNTSLSVLSILAITSLIIVFSTAAIAAFAFNLSMVGVISIVGFGMLTSLVAHAIQGAMAGKKIDHFFEILIINRVGRV